ncbi:hypothetical protein F4806DRAFT_76136 [Annulohypoxylon nitens]|nr:hypothetical protein F4806DRAFT_76136 [Annulohypoxylon nitens]
MINTVWFCCRCKMGPMTTAYTPSCVFCYCHNNCYACSVATVSYMPQKPSPCNSLESSYLISPAVFTTVGFPNYQLNEKNLARLGQSSASSTT